VRLVSSTKGEEEVSSEDQTFITRKLLCRSDANRVARAKPAPKEISSYPTAKSQRVAPRTTQVTPTYRQGSNWRYGGTRHYSGARYYGGNRYYGGTRYYSGGFGYPYYYSSWPYAYYGYYPHSSYEGYPYAYSYYSEPAHSYDASLVAQVQDRLADLGYYDGVIHGIMGRQTRAAISAYESTHNLVVDGMISSRLLDRMGLS
jgi:Putative peptidoglycan binding domain